MLTIGSGMNFSFFPVYANIASDLDNISNFYLGFLLNGLLQLLKLRG